MGKKLLPVKNVRSVRPRVCATCRYILFDDGSFTCARPGGTWEDAGNLRQWETTCDRWTPPHNEEEEPPEPYIPLSLEYGDDPIETTYIG